MNDMYMPWQLGKIEIKNRLVRSATVECLATEDGAPTQKLIDLTVKLAKGGVGLIIAGTAHISHEGQGDKNATGMDHDGLIGPLSGLCSSVQQAGGILAAQLLHCGSNAGLALRPEKKIIYGPSSMTDPVNGSPVVELNKDHILNIIRDYAKAAERAKKAGFQAVQIHAAHGYLINQFLSRSRNRRNDQYGGSVKNRARFLYQLVEEVRRAVGNHFPLLIKMSGHDGFPGGVVPDEAVEVASTLDSMGIDAIEVSAGTPEGAKQGGWDHIIPAPFKEGSFFNYALQVKEKVDCPVITVEGWRDPVRIIKALETIDAVSMSRPFIREPDLANRWLCGDLSPAKCISCNECLNLIETSGLGCIFHRQKKKTKGISSN